MPHLHHILRATILAATLLTGAGALAAAQAPAQAASAPPRMHAVTSSTHYQHVSQPQLRMR